VDNGTGWVDAEARAYAYAFAPFDSVPPRTNLGGQPDAAGPASYRRPSKPPVLLVCSSAARLEGYGVGRAIGDGEMPA
jgi:hypothetical protein